MAATTTTNSSIPLPTGEGFAGDEFSNNLFSDLAPLLTLFGEQVTKQFLSMSMGWADDVLLAMGPLGIMTVVVSAIRVGGVKTLKAFVGRARESRANAEKEILSSTSEDVCELWSGQEIVRELGNPRGMKDIILLDEEIQIAGARQPTRVLDISSAVTNKILELEQPSSLTDDEISDISNGAPNIALNVRKSTVSPRELLAWAVFGTMLQLSALVFPAVSTYHMGFKKGGSDIAAYGYPCFAAGTIAVIVGVIFCGRVIEGSTAEHNFKVVGSREVQIMRLQRACTVSDQHFSSYAIFNSPNDLTLRTSRLNNKKSSRMAAAATLTAIVGFVFQFVGLRALHWSATIYQLGVMLIMTMIRSLVRRGLATGPKSYSLLDGHEVAWLALFMLNNDEEDYADYQRTAHNEESASLDDERMLRVIGRLEPLTGYFSIDNMRTVLQRAIAFPGASIERELLLDSLKIENARLERAFYPLSTMWTFDSSNRTPLCDTRFLDVRRDLRRLMSTSNQADKEVTALALAMERTTFLLAQSENILWKDGKHPIVADDSGLSQISFDVRMVHGKYTSTATVTPQHLQLHVQMEIRDPKAPVLPDGKYRMEWKTDGEVLSSIISLWLFSLEVRKSAASKLKIEMEKLGPWMDTFVNPVIRRNTYYRIVASAPQPDEHGKYTNLSGLTQCSRWLDAKLHELPHIGDYSVTLQTVDTDTMEPLANTWVTWGSMFSASFDALFREDEDYNFAVLTRPETSIAGQCALELFSYFMEAVAARIDKLGGRTVVRLKDPISQWTYWGNSVLESIANECVAAGLAHDVNEANTIIIPAFIKHGVLPRKPHNQEIKWKYDQTGRVVDPVATAVQPGSSTYEATNLRHEQTERISKEEVEPKGKSAEIVTD